MLKERVMLKAGAAAKWRYDFQKKWLNPVKILAIVIYYVVVPFL